MDCGYWEFQCQKPCKNMKNQKGFSMLSVVMVLGFILIICIAGYFLYIRDNSQLPQPQNTTVSNTPTNQTANWNTVQNTEVGVKFKYPTDFGSKYASFQSTPIITVAADTSQIDANGCLMTPAYAPKESQVTINNMKFCLGTTSDPGAGQLYNTYNYTMLKNGSYITLQYVVHTLNGCGPYMGTPDYQPCTDFMNNYDTNVTKVIETSVGTLQFTK